MEFRDRRLGATRSLLLSLHPTALSLVLVVAVVPAVSAQSCRPDFDTARSYTVYDAAPLLWVEDIDGDGLPDVAVRDGGDVHPFLSAGDGWLEPIGLATSGVYVESMAMADFDGDGFVDLAVYDVYRSSLVTYLGDGAGGFSETWEWFSWCPVETMDVADFNGDGVADLAVSRCGMMALLGNGDGSFTYTGWYYSPLAVLRTADFDGDGEADVAGLYTDTLLVFLGNGDGTFTPQPYLPVGMDPQGLAVGDWNGDGDPDLATANVTAGDISVFLGRGNGLFDPAPDIRLPGASGIDAGDLDGDGNVDLVAVAELYPGSACAILGDGTGAFASPVCYPLTGDRSAVVVTDLDADGSLDVVTTGRNSLAVLRGRGDGTLPRDSELVVGRRPLDVDFRDLDADGFADIVTADATDQTISMLAGRGDGTYASRVVSIIGESPSSMALADFNGDGWPDVAITTDELLILRNSGAGTFLASGAYPAGGTPQHVITADLDGSGTADLVVSDPTETRLFIYLGLPDGSFVPALGVPVGVTPHRPTARDVNGDGVLDLLVACEADHLIYVAFGKGDGTFPLVSVVSGGLRPQEVLAADLSGDGITDLAITGAATREVSVLLGVGSGLFGPRVSYPALHNPRRPEAADVDDDGDLDLLVTSYPGVSPPDGTSHVVFLENLGAGTFATRGGLRVGHSPADLVLADANRDGAPDVMVADDMMHRVAVAHTRGLRIAPPLLSPGTLGALYVQPLFASGGIAPYQFSVVQGVLPPGVILNGSGQLQGVPTAAGTFVFEILVQDAVGCTRSLDYRLTIRGPGCSSLIVEPPFLPQGFLGTLYATTLTSPGATPPLQFSIVGGTLPPGLSLSPSGLLSGVPTSVGTFDVTIGLVDAASCVGLKHASLRVVDCAPLTVSPSTLPSGVQGASYSARLSTSGGVSPYVYSVLSGTLPPGLSLDPAGILSGTPTTSGSFGFVVQVVDALGCEGRGAHTLEIEPSRSFVVGQGLGQPNPNRVRVYRSDGRPAPVDFLAYTAGTWGVVVGGGNIDGGSVAEILSGPGPGPVHGPQIRAFDRSGVPIQKVNFYAYGTLRYGVNPAAGELDGDGVSEIPSGAGPGPPFGPHVRGFDYDGVAVTAISRINFFAYSTLRYGANISAGDLDRDGFAELLTGPGPGPSFGPTVRGFDYDGVAVTPIPGLTFDAYAFTHGVLVAAGDVDADLTAEIATAPGPGPANPSRFRGFDVDSGTVSSLAGYEVLPFTTLYGGRLALGDITGSFRWDLVAGAGVDPAAASAVRAFRYTGLAMAPLSVATIIPFAGGYGVNPGVVTLAW